VSHSAIADFSHPCAAYERPSGEMCGDPAPHEAAGTFFCDYHYERALQWAAEAGRTEGSLVYYVRRERDGLIKVGTSRVFASRFADLSREHGPLLIMAAHRGARREEAAVHRYFKALRAEGEWFRPELPLLEHILKVRAATAERSYEGLPPQLDLLELGRIISRLRRKIGGLRPVAVSVAVRATL
jgi:hypothetical protein